MSDVNGHRQNPCFTKICKAPRAREIATSLPAEQRRAPTARKDQPCHAPTAFPRRRGAGQRLGRDTLDNADQTCTSINGVVKCGGEEGTEWIVQFGSHRNDELRALADRRRRRSASTAPVLMGAVGGEHRGYGDVWMAGISPYWRARVVGLSRGPIERTRSRGWRPGMVMSSAAAGPTGTGARRASRGRWTVGEEDGMIRGGASGAGTMMMAARASCKRFREEGFHPGRGLGRLVVDLLRGGPDLRSCGRPPRRERLRRPLPQAFWDGRRVAGRFLGMMEDTSGRGRSARRSPIRWRRSRPQRPVPPSSRAARREVADGSFIGKGDVWVTKHDGKTGESSG